MYQISFNLIKLTGILSDKLLHDTFVSDFVFEGLAGAILVSVILFIIFIISIILLSIYIKNKILFLLEIKDTYIEFPFLVFSFLISYLIIILLINLLLGIF